jgi:hypothetical protein
MKKPPVRKPGGFFMGARFDGHRGIFGDSFSMANTVILFDGSGFYARRIECRAYRRFCCVIVNECD